MRAGYPPWYTRRISSHPVHGAQGTILPGNHLLIFGIWIIKKNCAAFVSRMTLERMCYRYVFQRATREDTVEDIFTISYSGFSIIKVLTGIHATLHAGQKIFLSRCRQSFRHYQSGEYFPSTVVCNQWIQSALPKAQTPTKTT